MSHQISRRHEPGFSIRQLSQKILITELHLPKNITSQLLNWHTGDLFNSGKKLEEQNQYEIRFFFLINMQDCEKIGICLLNAIYVSMISQIHVLMRA